MILVALPLAVGSFKEFRVKIPYASMRNFQVSSNFDKYLPLFSSSVWISLFSVPLVYIYISSVPFCFVSGSCYFCRFANFLLALGRFFLIVVPSSLLRCFVDSWLVHDSRGSGSCCASFRSWLNTPPCGRSPFSLISTSLPFALLFWSCNSNSDFCQCFGVDSPQSFCATTALDLRLYPCGGILRPRDLIRCPGSWYSCSGLSVLALYMAPSLLSLLCWPHCWACAQNHFRCYLNFWIANRSLPRILWILNLFRCSIQLFLSYVSTWRTVEICARLCIVSPLRCRGFLSLYFLLPQFFLWLFALYFSDLCWWSIKCNIQRRTW